MDVLVACKEAVSLKQVYWVVSETRQPMTCCFLWFRISYGGSYPVPPLMSPPSSHTLFTIHSIHSLILCIHSLRLPHTLYTLLPPPSYSVHFLHLPHTLYTLPHTLYAPRYPKRDSVTRFCIQIWAFHCNALSLCRRKSFSQISLKIKIFGIYFSN